MKAISAIISSMLLLLAAAPAAHAGSAAENGPEEQPSAAQTYQTEELAFSNGPVALAGTLYRPVSPIPFPTYVIMHGAGPDSREPYVPDARLLAENGIGAFIFDKRGTGDSTGDWRRSSLDDLMADGLAAVELVRQQPGVDPDQIGILGVSQGAWLAPFMAARSDAVAFFVQVTAAATPLANQEMWDDGNSLRRQGYSQRAVEMEMKGLHLLYSSRGLIRRGILPLGDLWFVHYDPYLDPADVWPRVDVPALVLYGGADPTVPTATSAAIVSDALDTTEHPDSRLVIFPGRGHALGNRNQDPAYATLLVDWTRAVSGSEPAPENPFPDAMVSPALSWYGTGAGATPWYATASFQLALMVGFLLFFAIVAVASVAPRIDLGGALPRLAMGVTGVVNVALLVGLLPALNYLLNADAEGYAPPVPGGGWLWLLAWAGAALAVMLGVAAVKTRGPRHVPLKVAAAGAWAFLPFIGYWQLFGGPF